MAWVRSWATGGGSVPGIPGDTVVFPWRTGDEALGIPEDEALPAAPTTRVRPFSADLGLLLVRLVVGGIALLDGVRVLIGSPRGSARSAVEATLGAQHFVRPDLLTTYLGWVQLVAGVLVLLGVFTSLAAAALLGVAVTAVGITVPAAVAAGAVGPVQGPLLAATAAATLVLVGPGRISADAGRAWERAQTATGLVGLLIGLGTGLTVLLALR